jgi:dTDP-4-dehydrorhamnose reductase
MKVTIIGANGQLGGDCFESFQKAGHTADPLEHEEADIGSIEALRSALKERRPEVVVNTAAYHRVEECESETEKAWQVNALGPRNLAFLSNELGFRLLHISTDYVFDGSKRTSYREDDLPLPLNVYGNTKLSGEHFISAISENGLSVRTSGIYGKHHCRAKGYDFVELMLKLAKEKPEVRVVHDEVLTPTPTHKLALQLVDLAEHDLTGVCHATPKGGCSWYDFTCEIWRIEGFETPLNKAEPGEFPVKVDRPDYSVLDNHRLREAGIDRFGTWQEELRNYLKG